MEKQLRIIHVVNVRWFNATAWYALFLARIQQSAGHTVQVYCLPDTPPAEIARTWELDVVELPLNTVAPGKFVSLVRALRQSIRLFKPDVVNCHRGEHFFLWALLRIAHPYTLVRTRGDQRLPKASVTNRFLHNRVADLVIATNSVTQTTFIEKLHTPPAHIALIPGGVDSSVFFADSARRDALRCQFGFNDTDIVVGFLGRFDRVKGVRELIEAVSETAKNPLFGEGTERRLRLLLAGFSAGITEDQVRQWLREYDLLDDTVITGKHPDVTACINAMDFGVIASQGSETIARAAFEIMGCDVPLIGTDVGVMPDLLPAWALSPTGNQSELNALVAKAATDSQWRERLRTECKMKISTLQAADFLSQTLQAYTRAMRRESNMSMASDS